MRRILLVATGLVAGLAVSCQPSTVFQCGSDGDCTVSGIEGVCQSQGYCSFPNEECASGQEYGEFAPDGLAETCVPVMNGTTSGDVSPGTSMSSSGSVVPDGTGSTDDGPIGPTETGDVTTGVGITTGPEPLDPDLVMWLSFDVIDGDTIVDDSGNGHDGRCVTPCPVPTAGVIDGAADFQSATVNLLEVLYSPGLETEQEGTVAVWIRPARFDGLPMTIAGMPQNLMNGVNSWVLLLDGADDEVPHDLLFTTFDGKDTYTLGLTTAQFPTDEWIHLAGTWNGRVMALYINGFLVSSAGVPPIDVDTDNIYVGAGAANNGDSWYEGTMDDLRLYSRALSPSEVAGLATDGT